MTDFEHYPQLYPTKTNKPDPNFGIMTHPNEGDFADDETEGASNRKDTYDDENTVATANLSEESIS